MTELVIQSVTALALVLALFAVVVWMLRWMQSRSHRDPHATIRIRQRTMLDSKHSLVEVEYAGELLLLGIGPNTITHLMQRSSTSSVSPSTQHSPSTQQGSQPTL
ncbi:MAG: flagellar biosynthetic protein FliO [Mariprofundales bacterium]|nr:flagellar biosynthetic protein FliO [Mariprofundales bacterium]